jgi:hypothetical protein
MGKIDAADKVGFLPILAITNRGFLCGSLFLLLIIRIGNFLREVMKGIRTTK